MKDRSPVLSYDEQVVLSLRGLYGAYGYQPFRMSRFEEYDLYVRNKAFLVSDSVITFTDTDGKLMALKPDVTLSIVKNCRPTAGAVEKLYYDENVFRVSQGTHAFREIKQAGLECIGSLDTASLSEVLRLAAESLAVIDGGYILDVSHLGVVEALLSELGIGEAGRAALLAALGSKNLHGARAILSEEGIDPERAERLFALFEVSGEPVAVLSRLSALLADCPAARSALSELEAVLSGVGDTRGLRIDFSVIHDMQYYNGIVFRGFVPGVAAGILSGGQYDRLVKKLGRAEGAVGFAVYLDLLSGAEKAPREADADLFLLYGEGDDPKDVLAAAERLRKEGQRVRTGRTVPAGFVADRTVALWEVLK
jgi:ATP phosphoribosyltransferase regulatory subunit